MVQYYIKLSRGARLASRESSNPKVLLLPPSPPAGRNILNSSVERLTYLFPDATAGSDPQRRAFINHAKGIQKGTKMLLHATITHSVNDCLLYNLGTILPVVDALRKRDDLAENYGIPLYWIVNGA